MRSARLRFLALVGALLLVLTACQVDVVVEIDVEEGGAGTVTVLVTLDEEAAAQIPRLERELRTSDLTEAGWTIDGPTVDDDGLTRITASKRFDSPDQLGTIMGEITGVDGAFREFELTRTHEFAKTSFEIEGVMDFSEGTELFADPALVEALGGDPFGRPISDIEAEFGEPVAEMSSFRLVVKLPGGAEGGGGREATWTARLDDVTPVQVQAEATDENLLAQILRWVAIAAFVLFGLSLIILLIGWFVEYRHRKAGPKVRTPESVRARVPVPAGVGADAGGGGMAGAPLAAPPPSEAARRVQLVVLDSSGVVFNAGGTNLAALTEFVRRRGGTDDAATLDEAYHSAIRGGISVRELWDAAGLEGDTDELTEHYLRAFKLRNGTRDFLKEMTRRHMRVTAIGNDVGEFSDRLRARHRLDPVYPWIVSSDIGVAKPDPGIYEALRREVGVPYENWLMIDAELDNLDAAKTLGMSTVWFTAVRPSADRRPDHSVVTSFAQFFRRRGG